MQNTGSLKYRQPHQYQLPSNNNQRDRWKYISWLGTDITIWRGSAKQNAHIRIDSHLHRNDNISMANTITGSVNDPFQTRPL